MDADCSDCAGHGTACAGIIRRKAPQALIYSVRIFDQSLSTTGEALLAALEWSIEQGMDVVNLSLGTTDSDFAARLRAACQRAASAGVVLVAAEHNEGKESYPATFPEVIGVTCGKVGGRYGYSYRPGAAVECVARGDAQRLSWLGRSEILSAGTSFATPHISGIVALIREAFPGAGVAKVRETLQAYAIVKEPEQGAAGVPVRNTVSTAESPAGPSVGRGYDWIRKAALYPYNKGILCLYEGM